MFLLQSREFLSHRVQAVDQVTVVIADDTVQALELGLIEQKTGSSVTSETRLHVHNALSYATTVIISYHNTQLFSLLVYVTVIIQVAGW